MDKKCGRIIVVSSTMHDSFDPQGEALEMYREEDKEMFENIESLARGVEYDDDGSKAGARRYGASKLLMVMFMCVVSPLCPPSIKSLISMILIISPGTHSNAVSQPTPSSPRFPSSLLIQAVWPAQEWARLDLS